MKKKQPTSDELVVLNLLNVGHGPREFAPKNGAVVVDLLKKRWAVSWSGRYFLTPLGADKLIHLDRVKVKGASITIEGIDLRLNPPWDLLLGRFE